jgi:rfaE bifunctional protein kinase chain/domain
VLVVGDLIADEYVFGETSRVSREAPVLIIRHVGRRVIPGGAGNAVLNLRALGARPLPIGVIGAGEISEEVLAELRSRGIDAAGVVRDAGRVAVRKTRVMAGGAHGQKQQVLRIDREETVPVPESLEEELLRLATERLPDVEGVLLSDYGYGTLGPRLVSALLDGARERGVPVCIDSRHALRRYRGATYATPNEEEAIALRGRPIEADGLPEAVEALRRELDLRFLLLTRGRDGMAIAEEGGSFREIPIWGGGEAADVTGAGDTVAASSLLALVAGGSPVEAAHLATIAAGIVVQKHGAATTTPEEIERLAGIRRKSPLARGGEG